MSYGALALLLSGCEALDRRRFYALLDSGPEVVVGDVVDARSDAAVDVLSEAGACQTSSEDAGACGNVRLPRRPAALSDTGAGSRPLLFAARRFVFGFAGRGLWGRIGFDRDGVCTDPAQTPPQVSCRVPGGGPPVEDGENGRDNALASRLASTFSILLWNEVDLEEGIRAGRRTAGLRVTGYSGRLDDGTVEVEWLPLMNGHAAGDPTTMPRFDGTDVWSIDRSIAYDPVDPTHAQVRSRTAYVSCGTLVAALPSRMPLRFNTSRVRVRLTLSGGVFVGGLGAQGTTLGPLDFSGYWGIDDALGDLAVLGVCPGVEPTWSLANQALSSALDLLSTGENSPGADCDAISSAFRSEWVPIQLGDDADGNTGVGEVSCGDAGTADSAAPRDAR